MLYPQPFLICLSHRGAILAEPLMRELVGLSAVISRKHVIDHTHTEIVWPAGGDFNRRREGGLPQPGFSGSRERKEYQGLHVDSRSS